MRHRAAGVLTTVLAVAAAALAGPAPAVAAAGGVDVTITELPARFVAGSPARTVTVVASAERGSCAKVRWSMLLEVDGVDLDHVQVDRIEEDGSFPLQVSTDGDRARLTDVRLDPGTLCPGRTVTARYLVAFDEAAPDGRVTFQAQAFDAQARLLEEASATTRVEGGESSSPSPSPSPSPSEDDEPEPDEESAAVPPAADGAPPANRAAAEGGVPSLLGPGLVIGALLVFLGVGLLLRLRLRNRATPSFR